jgi:phosphate transport system permease protein
MDRGRASGGTPTAGFEPMEAVLVDRYDRVGPQAPPPAATRRAPRRPRQYTLADIGTFAAALGSATALCWLIFARLTEGTGWLGFLACTYLAFLVMFTVATFDRLGWLVAKDRLATVVVTTGAVILFIPLVWLVSYIVIKGLAALRPTFTLSDMEGTGPTDPSTAGGGMHAIVGTIEQVGIALLLSLPLGLACAVFLNESRSRWRRPVRVVVDAMSGLPSIVAGIFIYAVFILPNQGSNPLLSFNGFMASLALAMIMLPPITRTVEVVLRLVPDGLREASLALGASRARTVWSVVLPTARTGVTTAVVLGLARAVGETAPLLFTAFGSIYFNANPFAGTQESLPLFVWRYIRDPSEASIERGFAGGLMLLLLVMSLFVMARYIGRDRSVARRRTRSRPRLTLSASPSTRAGLPQNRPALPQELPPHD